MTARYLLACEIALLQMGHTVIPIADGWYSDRHRRENQYAGTFPPGTVQVYCAAHINAGGGDYGAVLFSHQSRSGPELAARVAKQLRMVAPELNGVKRSQQSRTTGRATHTRRSAVSCSRSVYAWSRSS